MRKMLLDGDNIIVNLQQTPSLSGDNQDMICSCHSSAWPQRKMFSSWKTDNLLHLLQLFSPGWRHPNVTISALACWKLWIGRYSGWILFIILNSKSNCLFMSRTHSRLTEVTTDKCVKFTHKYTVLTIRIGLSQATRKLDYVGIWAFWNMLFGMGASAGREIEKRKQKKG